MRHGVRWGLPQRFARAAALSSALSLGLAACSTSEAASDSRPDEETMRYVAMGDSYTSAPGIAGENSTDGCLRSPRNYPSMVAKDLDVDEFVDVSCSGAQTLHVTREHKTPVDVRPPQIDALDADTDLVTLSIGANDYGLFSTLVRHCTGLGKRTPEGSPCSNDRSAGGYDTASMQITRIRDRVATAITQIKTRSQNARVIVVGYPQLVPEEGRCPERLPLAAGDYDYVRERLAELSESIEAGAEFAGAEYVNLLPTSDGHDICAKQPWINGVVEKPDRALPWHPYPAEQRAVADLILARI